VTDALDAILSWLSAAPPVALYAALGGAAALENLVPPVPADVVVVFGGLLAGRGAADPWLVFLAVWLCNVLGALAVYGLGVRYGLGFFQGRWGRMILRPHQLEQLDRFYRRYGFVVIFLSRFLPMFRAVVPVFAGVSRVGLARTAIPLAGASAIWYGALVYLGAAAGRNWDELQRALSTGTRWLAIPAALVLAAVAVWWWRSRHGPDEPG
jgi:membrane protein DedA with SNARE-associated domain